MAAEFYVDDDTFREERFYTREMDVLVSDQKNMLRMVYDYYRRSAQRPKGLPMQKFCTLLDDVDVSHPA
eukprot:9344607-Pyramimonas_sp.AAC.1